MNLVANKQLLEPLKYLLGYSEATQTQVRQLMDEQRLGEWLLNK